MDLKWLFSMRSLLFLSCLAFFISKALCVESLDTLGDVSFEKALSSNAHVEDQSFQDVSDKFNNLDTNMDSTSDNDMKVDWDSKLLSGGCDDDNNNSIRPLGRLRARGPMCKPNSPRPANNRQPVTEGFGFPIKLPKMIWNSPSNRPPHKDWTQKCHKTELSVCDSGFPRDNQYDFASGLFILVDITLRKLKSLIHRSFYVDYTG